MSLRDPRMVAAVNKAVLERVKNPLQRAMLAGMMEDDDNVSFARAKADADVRSERERAKRGKSE